jgi:dihydroorotase
MAIHDLLIQGGYLIEPGSGREGRYDIAVSAGRVSAIAPDLSPIEADTVLDASGLVVTPGFVDLHTHCYWGATYWGIEPDPVAARSGVTTWVDAGSAGAYSFHGFRRFIADVSQVRVLAFLNVSGIGLVGPTYELSILEHCDVELAAEVIDANRDVLVGVKARVDADTTRGQGTEPLRRARQLADNVGLPLMVHIGTAPPALSDILALMRPGDILTHCCTDRSNRVVDSNGRILPFVRDLAEQGLVLDLGHGGASFSFRTAESMLAAGMPPDVISSDIHQFSVLGPMQDLLTTMSKFLLLGMSLTDVVARVTCHPARALGRAEIGRLAVGSPADIAVFRVEEGDFTFYDTDMESRRGSKRLCHVATYRDGVRARHMQEQPPAPWARSQVT